MSETNRTYAAESAFELEMPPRVLTINEANEWIAAIAENEGVDRPLVLKLRMSSHIAGIAFSKALCIAVRNSKPTQLLLLHEMAHLICANKNHGTEFRTQLVRLVRHYVSLPHAAALHKLFCDDGLTISPFAATGR